MRTSSTLVLLLATLFLTTHATVHVSGAPPRSPGHGCGKTVEDTFYCKAGNFGVVIYSLWHDISPAPVLECVISASTWRPRGNTVDYLVVLRVAGLGICEVLVWGVSREGSRDWKLKYFKRVS